MASVSWLIRRLKAMSIPEVLWRLSQKCIQKKEEKQFGKESILVSSSVFNSSLSSLQPQPERLYINYDNTAYELNTAIHLLAGADYEEYKKHWKAGFQTGHTWPDTFSYRLEYKQRDDIGDARTNWELNRHFQFALLAKDYAASGDKKYLDELKDLFTDWNDQNPFLHGISWTSVMEVAIRCSNWCYTYAFLEHSGAEAEMLEKLRIGILNMTDYIAGHYSRYSSANNHLIVEAYTIGQSGILFDYPEWTKLAVKILTRELPLQNYPDGINKELSLHYQSFYMEAMGLMMRLLKKNGIAVPDTWHPMLSRMSQYVADCIGDYGEVVVFGDDDEGKILDLQGGDGINHYQYVLAMMSLLLEKQYTDVKTSRSETIDWLFTKEEKEETQRKDRYTSPQYCCYQEGGNTILRSKDRKVLIGIDHAALGFGSIAAHGHADALSFQLFYEGQPVFVDPGTYIYHCDLDSRNKFRKTCNHNTVTMDNKDQSEMLGAFLWGRKAKSKLISIDQEDSSINLVMEHDGYSPMKHFRTLLYDGNNHLQIKDQVTSHANALVSFILVPGVREEVRENSVYLYWQDDCIAKIKTDGMKMEIVLHEYSNHYGMKQPTKGISIMFEKQCVIDIELVNHLEAESEYSKNKIDK